jgi:hypothetical protein
MPRANGSAHAVDRSLRASRDSSTHALYCKAGCGLPGVMTMLHAALHARIAVLHSARFESRMPGMVSASCEGDVAFGRHRGKLDFIARQCAAPSPTAWTSLQGTASWQCNCDEPFAVKAILVQRWRYIMQTKRWQDWLTLVLGAWLFVSPFWMDAYASTASTAAWNSYIFGALVFIFACAALANRKIWEEWVNLAIGIWIVIAPFVLGFYGSHLGTAWNHWIVGAVVAIDALWVIGQTPSHTRVGT